MLLQRKAVEEWRRLVLRRLLNVVLQNLACQKPGAGGHPAPLASALSVSGGIDGADAVVLPEGVRP